MNDKSKLPSMEYRFDISVNGDESNTVFLGSFTYKRPTIAVRSMIEQMRVRLNGDLRTLDNDIALNNEALSMLRFTLIDSPQWWKDSDYGGNLHDENVIFELYNKCIQFESEWRKKVFGGKAEAVSEQASNSSQTP